MHPSLPLAAVEGFLAQSASKAVLALGLPPEPPSLESNECAPSGFGRSVVTIAISDDLQLEPRPPILGLVPSLYDNNRAIHREYLQQLPEVAAQLRIKLYPQIRDSSEFKNASANGLPLQKYRPAHPAGQDFQAIAADLFKLARKGKQ